MAQRTSPLRRRPPSFSSLARSGLAIAPLIVAVVGGGSLLAAAGMLTARWRALESAPALEAPAQVAPAADTVRVYGPRRFHVTGARRAMHVEEFRIVHRPEALYRVLVFNGAPDGSRRADRGRLRLNDMELVTTDVGPVATSRAARDGSRQVDRDRRRLDFIEPVRDDVRLPVGLTVFEDVRLGELNALLLEIEGQAGAYITLTVEQITLPTTTIFGPVELIREGDDASGKSKKSDKSEKSKKSKKSDKEGDEQGESDERSGKSKKSEKSKKAGKSRKSGGGGNEASWVFDVPGDTEAPFTLFINNGYSDGLGRASEARVTLNGVVVFDDAHFGADVGALEAQVTLVPAGNLLELFIAGETGTRIEAYVTATVSDDDAPLITITSPADGFVTSSESVVLLGTVEDISPVQVDVNGVAAQVTGGSFSADVPLTLEGPNVLTVTATDASGNSATEVVTVVLDTTAPVITLAVPADGLIATATPTPVTGSVSDANGADVVANGVPLNVDQTGAFGGAVELVSGSNVITVVATDPVGNQAVEVRTVTLDIDAPVLTVTAPTDGLETNDATVTVTGSVTDLSAVTVDANGVPLPVDGAGQFSGDVTLGEGANIVTITATDAGGRSSRAVRIVNVDTTPPELTVTQPADLSSTTDETVVVSGTASDLNLASVTVNGAPVTPDGTGAFSTLVSLVEGPNPITVVATDGAGNTTSDVRTVTRTVEPGHGFQEVLPLDLSVQAPAIDLTVATTVFDATRFLYEGAGASQTGVPAGTIVPKRASVVRGRVLDRQDRPLSGVEITVLGHPEYGSTTSRTSGQFQLVVNGGGQLTLTYDRPGFLPAQRAVNPTWQEYVVVDDVVLVQLDPVVTTVDLSGGSTGAQVARGTPQTDDDGTRTATVIFPPSVQGEMVLPGGGTQPLTTGGIRATEYTVGPNGPQAMPAELPPSSGYTYAVELSVDEAIAAGAESVRFDRPVALYLENFLDFPTGMVVPVGIYDATTGVWRAEQNGRVVEVVSIDAGEAQVDFDGDGIAEDAATLDGLGIEAPERAALGGLYAPGEQLWRMPLLHFSPVDGNWPVSRDDVPADLRGSQGQDQKPDDSCEMPQNSVIECQGQVLRESVGLVGTRFALNYQSDRVDGREVAYRVTIPVSTESPPPTVSEIRAEVDVAGRRFEWVLPAEPSQSLDFQWDGRDAFGRFVQGEQRVHVRIYYRFPQYYLVPDSEAQAFGLVCRGDEDTPGWSACILPGAREDASWASTEWTGSIGTFANQAAGLGAWSLGVHHAYDPGGQVLYLGDGTRRTIGGGAIESANLISTVLGTPDVPGADASSPDGTPAITARVNLAGLASELAFTPDGELLVTEWNEHRVRRVDSDGILRTLAGTGEAGFAGDGGPASAAQLDRPGALAVAPDGGVYIADTYNQRVRYVSPEGIITTVAGNGEPGTGQDGPTATDLRLGGRVSDMALAPDGTLFIALRQEGTNHVEIRRLATDGGIRTITGAQCSFRPTDVPLPQSGICPRTVAVDERGALYVLSRYSAMFRIDPDGSSTMLGQFGGGARAPGPQAVPQARPRDPSDITVLRDGTILLTDGITSQVVYWRDGGAFFPFAGSGLREYSGDGGPALQAAVGSPGGIVQGPDGAVYFTDSGDGVVRRVAPQLPGFDGRALQLVHGSDLLVFDAVGRHLATLDATTGATRFQFDYADSRLSAVTDAFGNVTTIERDANGVPTAVVAPSGQRTELVLDGGGRLATVTNPAGEATAMTYHAGDLLATFTNPLGAVSTFAYDSIGRLARDEDAAGGFIELTRSEWEEGYDVEVSTALGRTSVYSVVEEEPGDETRYVASPGGLVHESRRSETGEREGYDPDGTFTLSRVGPDPRWKMDAPVLTEMEIETPYGLYQYIEGSREVELSDPDDPLSLISQTDVLDVNGRTFTRTYTAADRTIVSETPEGRRSVVRLGTRDELLEQTLPGQAAVNYFYDARGRLSGVSQGGRSWQYSYDAAGRLATATDPLARSTQFYYDTADRLTRRVLPDGREVGYGYDAAGNPISVTPAGRPAHTFQYNAVNRATEYRPPTVDATDPATRYSYDLDRAVTQVMRPDGISVDFSYDDAGRTSQVSFPGGFLEYGYNLFTGQLTALNGPYGGALTMTYDGSLLTEVEWAGEVGGTVGAAYNDDFRVRELRVNGAQTAAYGYDGDGFLIQAGMLNATRDAASGRLASTTVGSVTSALAYNEFGEIATLDWAYASAPLVSSTYTRDASGRIATKAEVRGGVASTIAYAYDVMGRLMQVERDGELVESYAYDANGNRTSLTNSGGLTLATYDAQDRLLTYGSNSYTYAADGSLASKINGTDQTQYAYDPLGNLLSVDLPGGTRIDYVVDGVGRRIGRKIGGTLERGWLYQNGLNPVAELDGSGAVMSRFVYGTRDNVPDYMETGGATYRLVSDELGSVLMVVDVVTGTPVQELAYDAWGRVLLDTNPGFQPFGYAGGLYDPYTGLVRFGARDYDAEVGRWTAKDPIGFGGGDANLYSYVSGDPINFSDPRGLCRIEKAWKHVGDVDLFQHAYIRITDAQSGTWVFRGGPGWGFTGNPLTVDFTPEYTSKDPWEKMLDSVVVYEDDCPCAPFFKRLADLKRIINNARLPYQGIHLNGMNSNSVARQALFYLGLEDRPPPEGMITPGRLNPLRDLIGG